MNSGATFTGNIYAPNIVTSVNGSTGAITNVARINEGNTFTVRQVMNAGATMTALFVSNGITFNGTRFELTNNSSPTIIGTNTSTNNLVLRANNSSAVIPADSFINLRGGDLDTPTYGEIDLSAGSGRVNINTGTFGVTANQTLSGTLNVTGLGTFNAGITASGATLNGNVAISGTLRTTGLGTFASGISASSSSYTLDIIETTDGAGLRIAKAASGANSRIGGIRLGRSTTVGANTYLENSIGTFTIFNGIGNTGTALLQLTTTGANFNVPITFTGGLSGSGDITLTGDGASNATIKAIGANTFILNASPASGVIKTGVNTSQFVPFGDGTTDLGTSSAKWKSVNAQGATFTGKVYSDGGYVITSNAINTQTSTYTLTATDNGKVITMNSASGITLAVPTGLPVGYNTTIISLGTGLVGISAASGVTLNSFEGKLRIAGQHAAASIISYSTNIFNVAGGLTA